MQQNEKNVRKAGVLWGRLKCVGRKRARFHLSHQVIGPMRLASVLDQITVPNAKRSNKVSFFSQFEPVRAELRDEGMRLSCEVAIRDSIPSRSSARTVQSGVVQAGPYTRTTVFS